MRGLLIRAPPPVERSVAYTRREVSGAARTKVSRIKPSGNRAVFLCTGGTIMFELKQTEFGGKVTEEMVNYVRKLVRARYRVRPVPGVEVEDVEQVALEETVKHIHKYDSSKAPLSGFLSVIAMSAISICYKYAVAECRWNDQQPIAFEQAEIYGCDAVKYFERKFETVRLKVDLLFYSGVNDIEHRVAIMLYSGLSQREISRRLGISRKRVRRIVSTIGSKYMAGTSYCNELS